MPRTPRASPPSRTDPPRPRAPASLPSSLSSSAPSTAVTLLVVEDQQPMREAMVEVLSSRGYRVLTAEDGVEALEVLALEVRAHHAPPALVVTDLQMPRLDGAGLMARMQEDADLCEVPVLVATSAPGAPPGAAGFLHKPFSLRELLAAVEGRLSSAAAPH